MAERIALGYRIASGLFIHSVQVGKSMDKSSYHEFFSIMFFFLAYGDLLFFATKRFLLCVVALWYSATLKPKPRKGERLFFGWRERTFFSA
ncbi:hypothetical protein D1093_08935 [Bartonella kosoyi]|uniref:Uncharacterized protein n=1 Tax=Bartonella kosoyi TaxID=2133959 RepID=A0A5B9CZ10_9HYPH|nr:hypothetical protein [Bartonella kosoyi]QEE09701.1 hypothetical protein D1093_08935 [Bartonella kosoyi]